MILPDHPALAAACATASFFIYGVVVATVTVAIFMMFAPSDVVHRTVNAVVVASTGVEVAPLVPCPTSTSRDVRMLHCDVPMEDHARMAFVPLATVLGFAISVTTGGEDVARWSEDFGAVGEGVCCGCPMPRSFASS